jgi:hypothetical protein
LFFLFAFLGEGNANLIKERKGAKGKKWEMRRKRWLGFKVKGLKMCPGAMMKSMARFLIGCERIHWLDYLFSFSTLCIFLRSSSAYLMLSTTLLQSCPRKYSILFKFYC